MQMSFPYHFRIEITPQNWIKYKDGWSLFSDIRSEIKR
jgi:hypothetical protein